MKRIMYSYSVLMCFGCLAPALPLTPCGHVPPLLLLVQCDVEVLPDCSSPGTMGQTEGASLAVIASDICWCSLDEVDRGHD